MQIIVFLIITGVFMLLTLVRVGGARRRQIMEQWFAVVLLLVAAFELVRGSLWMALGLVGAAALSWVLASSQVRTNRAETPRAPDKKDLEARAVLGVGPNATVDEIQAAYRAKMASAHPDLGGTHAAAAKLNGARDRLLRR